MASQFYNRYVPPTKAKLPADIDHARASKRRRIDEDSVAQPSPKNEKPGKKDRKREKIKPSRNIRENAEQPQINGQEATQSASESLEAKRHRKLKQKLENAALTSERSDELEAKKDGTLLNSNEASDSEQNDLPAAIPEPGLAPLPQPASVLGSSSSTLVALPEWLQDPTRIPVSSTRSLSELLPETMTEVLLKNGYEDATPIQQGLLPMLMPSNDQYAGDICIASSTGTGKTLAFVAPMVEALRHRPVRRLRGLVIVPTREIVSQTQTLAHICATKTGLQVSTATGIKTISEERKLLVRKTARYDNIRWSKTAGAKFDPINYETSEDDTSDKEYKFMQVFEGYVPEYRSKADILICTPGRLVEHLQSTKGFTLDHVEWLIVDEMDRLLDQSFQDWTEAVLPALENDPKALSTEDAVKAGLAYIRSPRRVRKVLASATVTFDPEKLASMHLWRPKLVTLQLDEANVKQAQFQIPPTLREMATSVEDVADKPLVLLRILETIFAQSTSSSARQLKATPSKPRSPVDEADSSDESTSSSGSSLENTSSSGSSNDSSDESSDSSPPITRRPQQPGVLVFTSKNENAMRLSRLLTILDPKLRVGAFTGSSKSSDRRKALAAFKKGELRIIIASNLASRSLNLTGLENVINYDTPTSVEMYIHRVGRTARAGRAGTANTLLAHHERRWFWNEIARSEVIERQQKVERAHAPPLSGNDRKRYETALQQLGEEARGS